jgi:hypothetical protein
MEKIVVESEQVLIDCYWALVLDSSKDFLNNCLNEESFSNCLTKQNRDELMLKFIMLEVSIIHSYILSSEKSSNPSEFDLHKLMFNKLQELIKNNSKDYKNYSSKFTYYTSKFKEYSFELLTDIQNREDQFFFPKSSLKALEIFFDSKDEINNIVCILEVFNHANAMFLMYHDLGKKIVFQPNKQSKPFWKLW